MFDNSPWQTSDMNSSSPAKRGKMLAKAEDHSLKLKDFSLYHVQLGFKPQWGEIFQTHPDKPRGQPLLYNGYQIFFSGLQRPGHGIDQQIPSRAEAKYWQSYTSTSPLCLLGM
jgi:hypothetical protein